MKYDITLGFSLSGSNSFGAKETLQATRTYSVEGANEKEAIENAKAKEDQEITSVSVCKR